MASKLFCCVAYKLGVRFIPKVNIINIDDHCDKYVENIVKYYILDTQEAVTDDYYRLEPKILDIKNNNSDILKCQNESPQMGK